MSRFLITDTFPSPPAEVPANAVVIAPHSAIGRSIGASTKSLQNCAKEVLKRGGFGIATPIRAAAALRQAVQLVIPNEDASAAARHHREIIGSMLRSGIDLKKLAAVGSVRSRTAATVAGRYVDILHEEHLIDSDAVLWTALENDFVRPIKAVIYGYFRARQLAARPEEIEFIDRIAGDESIFYLPCGSEPLFAANRDWLELMKRRGWKTTETVDRPVRANRSQIIELARQFACGGAAKKELGPGQIVEAVEFPDLESEVRGTLARAKASARGGVALSKTAIVCRDIDLYARAIISTAKEYGIPVEIDREVPIRDTAFGEFVSLLIETLELRSDEEKAAKVGGSRQGFLYDPTLRLMLHRFGPGLSDEMRARAYATRPTGFDRWYEITDAVEHLAAVGDRDGAGWTMWLKRLFINWLIRGPEKLGASAADAEAYDRFFDALNEHSRERGSLPISISDFAAGTADVLANISTRLHPERGGIKLLLPNDAVGAEFEQLFVIGMAEGILPAPSIDSNVIDFCEREKLRKHDIHFENALEVPRWEALTFYFTLLSSTGKIVFSYPRFAADREQIESSYFKRMGIRPVRSDRLFVSSVPEYRRAYLTDNNGVKDDDTFTAAKHQYAVESRRESDLPPDEYDGVIGERVERTCWSASSLSRIGSCPFKWFAKDLLHLNVPDEAETDLGGDVRGNLFHRSLELAVGRKRDADDLRFALLEIIEDVVLEAEALDSSFATVSNWDLRRAEQVDQLRIAIMSEHFLAEGAAVVDTEKGFEAEFGGLLITGTIDRIDRLADGKLNAVDYKSGSYIAKIKDEDGYLKIDIQLPIYTQIAIPSLYPGESCSEGHFLHLSDPKITKGKGADLHEIFRRITALLERGSFAVDPDVKHEACKYCEYDVVCRRGPRLARKRELT